MKLIPTLLAVMVSGCTSITPIFSKTGEVDSSPLKPDCNVSIYTTQPKKDYDEIGIIDINYYWGFTSPDEISTASGVHNLIKNQVCDAGGNAILLWEANGDGFYTKATVVKTRS
jgi:hypothetical protein